MPTTKSKKRKKAPLTYKQLVRKCCKDRRFARKIHNLVCKARGKDEEAAEASKELDSILKITPADAKECCLTATAFDTKECLRGTVAMFKTNPTTFLLLDFTKMV